MNNSHSLSDLNKEITNMTVYGENLIDLSENYWCYLPENALLQIFSYLDYKDILNAGLVCKNWNNISYDDLLWRDIFRRDFKIDKTSYPSKLTTFLNSKFIFFVLT